ncbi:MAG: hypothetical protein C0490_05355 [Marivirga sp.]|nr:hypothetical protein [Marivirga sp.]
MLSSFLVILVTILLLESVSTLTIKTGTFCIVKRSSDFLRLYLNPTTDDLAVIENKTTLEPRKKIKHKKILELQIGIHGSAVLES